MNATNSLAFARSARRVLPPAGETVACSFGVALRRSARRVLLPAGETAACPFGAALRRSARRVWPSVERRRFVHGAPSSCLSWPPRPFCPLDRRLVAVVSSPSPSPFVTMETLLLGRFACRGRSEARVSGEMQMRILLPLSAAGACRGRSKANERQARLNCATGDGIAR